MSDTTSNLGLPFLIEGQAQKHLTHNEALEIVDAVAQLVLAGLGDDQPPVGPAEGEVWAVGPAPTGDWAGQAGRLATFANNGWLFITPKIGWVAQNAGGLLVWDGSGWVAPELPPVTGVDGVGINTGYDATNRLSVAADATLLSHAGAGHQLKINKSGATETASLLFQSGWSGRAEMGLAGEDAFTVKVSADGAVWTTGLRIDSATGVSELPSGARSGTGTAASPSFAFLGDADTGIYRAAANRLGFATGGLRRATLDDAGLIVDVPISGLSVVQSGSDVTAGRVLTVGYGGLGGTAPSVSGTGALDSCLTGGARSVAATEAGPSGGPTSAGAGFVTVTAAADGSARQDYVEAAGSQRRWVRDYDGANWTAWRRVAEEIVGPLSGLGETQSGGIFERGSGAGGDYVKFADGTMVAWVVSSDLTTDTALGSSGFYCAGTGFDWTFPVAFDAAPVVTVTARILSGATSASGYLTSAGASSTGCSANAQSFGTGDLSLHLVATGRWA